MTSKRNDAFDIMKVINAMTRKTTNAIVFPCVLKTIISHTHRDDATFTRNDKQIRATLRAKFADAHVKNTSWVASNMRDYDRIRSAFDNAYATRIANARKRAPKSTPAAADA